MNTKIRIALALIIASVLVVALAVGGWIVYTAYAQGGTPNTANGFDGCHGSQAVVDLLKTSATDLKEQRQAGKSLLEIATSKGVSEQALTDALQQPMDNMHSWMEKNYPGFDGESMDQAMLNQTTKDIRETKYGTMTDLRVFGAGMMNGGMMNGSNSAQPGGMMDGSGMMGGSDGTRPGGMMNGQGMMGGQEN